MYNIGSEPAREKYSGTDGHPFKAYTSVLMGDKQALLAGAQSGPRTVVYRKTSRNTD